MGTPFTGAGALSAVGASVSIGLVSVASGGGLIALWPDPLPDTAIGVPYSYTLTASGGVAPYTYAVTSGALPAGLSLDSATGVISGVPTTAESLAAVTFSVTDSA